MARSAAVFAATLELRDADDGHVLRGIVVPWDEPTTATGEGYVETFRRGAFAKSIAERGDRISLTEMHRRESFPIGRARAWDDTADGLVATFGVASSERGREAITLVREGYLDGLSVGFRPIRNNTRTEGGVRHVERVEAALDHVGLVASPAYAGAKVLEARDDSPRFDPDNPAVAPRLARYRALHGLRGS